MQAGHQKTEQIRQAINAEDYKRAVKLAVKLDKNDLARAMQAYALERLGRRDEALAICDSVPRTDPMVLLWLSHAYGLARRYADLAQMQLKAFEATPVQPADRYCKMGVHAFEAVLRTYDFAEAQTLVLKIAKANTTNTLDVVQLWLWAATLGFLKAPVGCAQDDPSLMMAEAFFGKAASAGKTGALRTMGLPLKRWILVRRGKFAEALQSLAHLPDESKSARSWTKSLLLRLIGGAEKEEEEFQLLLKMVENPEASDDFRAYARLARLAVASDDRESALREMIRSIIAKNEKLRGPLLALVRLEVEKYMKKDTDGGAGLSKAVLLYLEKKGHLAAAFFDLQNDLSVFAPLPPTDLVKESAVLPGDRVPIVAQICPYLIPAKEFVDSDRESRRWSMETTAAWRVASDVKSQFIAQVQAMDDQMPRPAYNQVLRAVGVHESLSKDQLEERWQKYVSRATAANAEGDVATADDWILLAAHVLLDLSYKFETSIPAKRARLIQAAAVLQSQLDKSADNFQLKLALNDLFGHRLGAALPASDAFKQLRVKQIQLDALGFIALADFSACGFFEEAHDCAQTICEFSSRARGETADCFAEAFRFVESSSPVEVVRLENRLRDSQQATLAIVERCVSSLLPRVSPAVPGSSGKKKDSTQGGEEEEKKAATSLFHKVKVEIEDPPRGEAHVCLPEHRLVHVFRKLDDAPSRLIVNADLDVQACFDPPFSSNWKREVDSIQPYAGPCARIPREASNSLQFLKAWHDRSDLWLRLRVLAVAGLVVNPPVNESKIKEMRELSDKLGLLRSGELAPFYEAGFTGFEVLSSGNLDVADAIIAHFEELEKRWSEVDKIKEMFGNSPRQFLEGVSTALSHGGLWIFAILARLNNAYKKASKTKPFPMDSTTFVKIRETGMKSFSRVGQSLEAVQRDVSAISEHDQSTALPEEFKAAFSKAAQAVVDSHNESLRRLASLATVFSSFDLYLT